MKPVIAFFPGQGSQHVGMAKDLFENFKVAREIFEEASDATSLHLRKLCFEGPESDLVMTENTQPALLTASYAAYKVAEGELGFAPAAAAGHSLGEYSALVATGALPLASAARWVRERGKAMQTAVPPGQGGMAAIMGMDDAKVDALCAAAVESAKGKRVEHGSVSSPFGTGKAGDTSVTVPCVLSPANSNAPGQTVIAGSADAVAEAVALIKAGGDFAGGKAIPLAVSAPFHCALMKPARDRMAELFKDAPKPQSMRFPYVPNRTARLSYEPTAIYELLVDQVDHTVLWRQSVAMLIEKGYAQACEFGPGKVLQGLSKRIAGGIEGASFSCIGLSDSGGLAGLKTILGS